MLHKNDLQFTQIFPRTIGSLLISVILRLMASAKWPELIAIAIRIPIFMQTYIQ